MFKYKSIAIITLLVFGSAGFSILDDFTFIRKSSLEAARRSRNTDKKKTTSKSSSKTSSNTKKTDSTEEVDKQSESSDFLADNDKAKSYMPDIYRCPDCGYEQDEAGFCPDHTTLELVKVISDVNSPLAPSELDGNEDILVDVPLHIEFKKDELETKKEEEKTDTNKKSDDKSSKKSKKSK